MDLREATDRLLHASDIGKWMRLADSYIQAYNRIPDQFVLPKEHQLLKPIIDAFALDTQAFATYIRAMRDGSEGSAYDELHDLYRTISVRALQAQRRSRIRKAALLLVPLVEQKIGRVLRYDDEVIVAKFVEQRWGSMRMMALASARGERQDKRLPSEDRAVMLEEFWRSIDRKLEQGEVPLGDEPGDGINQVVKLFS